MLQIMSVIVNMVGLDQPVTHSLVTQLVILKRVSVLDMVLAQEWIIVFVPVVGPETIVLSSIVQYVSVRMQLILVFAQVMVSVRTLLVFVAMMDIWEVNVVST